MLNCHCPETKVTPPWGHVAPLPPPTDLSLRPWHQVISKINLQSFMPGLTILPKETTIMVDPHQCWTKLTPLYHCLWLEIPMGVYRLHQWWTHLVSLHLPVDQPQGKWSKSPLKKYSNKLSMKALAVWIYVLVDSIFKIQIVLEWVFQQVIFHSSYYMYIKVLNRSKKGNKVVWSALKGSNSGQNGSKRVKMLKVGRN